MRAAVFLDRDGVISVNRQDYVKSWSEFAFLPGALDALERLAHSEYAIVVISNQSAVGRGLISLEELSDIHVRMKRAIEAHRGRLDGVYFCPHTPNEACQCRKPEVGMFHDAANQLDLDLSCSYMVGDTLTDLLAGGKAACKPVLLLTGLGEDQRRLISPQMQDDCMVFQDLLTFVKWLVDK